MSQQSREQTLKAAIAKAEHYCASRECCRFDLERKLEHWEIPGEMWEEVLSHLEKYEFVDEERYIRTFIESKFKYNSWGKIKIKYALKQKNLPETLIEDLLEEIEPGEYREKLRDLTLKKADDIKGKNNYEKRQKVLNALMSKGFEPSLTSEVLDEENIFKL